MLQGGGGEAPEWVVVDGLQAKGMTGRRGSGKHIANSQLARAELGPRREEQERTCSTPTFPKKASVSRVGPRPQLQGL